MYIRVTAHPRHQRLRGNRLMTGSDGMPASNTEDKQMATNITIEPSILSANLACLGEQVQEAEAGADRLIVHQETCPHLYCTMQVIRALGVEAGVAICPGTPVSVLDEVLDLADVVQIMTVNPGFGGQEFIFAQLEKIKQLRQMILQRDLSTRIAVDGGINSTTAPRAAEAGATILVAGSSIFNSDGPVAKNLEVLQASLADIMVH